MGIEFVGEFAHPYCTACEDVARKRRYARHLQQGGVRRRLTGGAALHGLCGAEEFFKAE